MSQNVKKHLELGLSKFREAPTNVRVIISTIPEVRGQSSRMGRRVAEGNCVIKGLSRRLGYSVMEVNMDLYETGLLPQNFVQAGIHYGGATGRRHGNSSDRRRRQRKEPTRQTSRTTCDAPLEANTNSEFGDRDSGSRPTEPNGCDCNNTRCQHGPTNLPSNARGSWRIQDHTTMPDVTAKQSSNERGG